MTEQKPCKAMGCKNGKVALLIGFADCKECGGTGFTYEQIGPDYKIPNSCNSAEIEIKDGVYTDNSDVTIIWGSGGVTFNGNTTGQP